MLHLPISILTFYILSLAHAKSLFLSLTHLRWCFQFPSESRWGRAAFTFVVCVNIPRWYTFLDYDSLPRISILCSPALFRLPIEGCLTLTFTNRSIIAVNWKVYDGAVRRSTKKMGDKLLYFTRAVIRLCRIYAFHVQVGQILLFHLITEVCYRRLFAFPNLLTF